MFKRLLVAFGVIAVIVSMPGVAEGDVSFSGPTNYPVGWSPSSVAVGNFTNDSRPDLAVTNTDSHRVSVLLADGSGGFGTATDFVAGTTPCSVAVGDSTEIRGPTLRSLIAAPTMSRFYSGTVAGGLVLL